jgi:Zn-dependent protease with chaperone function
MTPLIARIGWTLLHSLWELTLIWAAWHLGVAVLRRRSPQARYVAGCWALGAGVCAPGLTFFRLGGGAATGAGGSGIWAALDRASPWIALAWAIGCSISLSRLTAGFARVRALAQAPRQALPDALERRGRELARRLGIRRAVQLGESLWVEVPSVVGWLKPVVLIPAGALAGLAPGQIDALIAHELAHICRQDFLVNALQSVAEALFFYHPAIRAINRGIRREREQACDDLAVALTGDALVLAQALAHLEETRRPELVLAANGGGDLLGRIRRLVAGPNPATLPFPVAADRSRTGLRMIAALNCAVALLLLPLTSFAQNQAPALNAPRMVAAAPRAPAAPAPAPLAAAPAPPAPSAARPAPPSAFWAMAIALFLAGQAAIFLWRRRSYVRLLHPS